MSRLWWCVLLNNSYITRDCLKINQETHRLIHLKFKIKHIQVKSKPVVTVKQGDLRGLEIANVTGGSYVSFKGVPYATPPVGDLRFKDPQPSQPWMGVRDAFEEGSKAAQLNLFTKTIVGSDDCLHLNIATASLTESRPVMVWIHGGGFVLGGGGFDMFGPDYLVKQGVVYVAINYRLGVLGFLNVDHAVAPGNFGLKDQVAALKWVQENIAKFGGDPNNVTIFGGSAGGGAVHYLLLSPLAKGLFHKAIMQSGVALNPYASNFKTVEMARSFVAALGQDINDPEEIVNYLRTVPAHRLIEVQETFISPEEIQDLKFPFLPSVDDKSVEPFMPKKPNEILPTEGSDVPVIIGYNSHEGLLFLGGLLWPKKYRKKSYAKLNENFEMTLPKELIAKAPLKLSEIAKDIKKFYFGDKHITNEHFDEYAQYYGDLHFVYGIHKTVEHQCQKKSPTYFYKFSFDNGKSPNNALFKTEANGAGHGDELQYLFVAHQFLGNTKFDFGITDQIVHDRFVRMWTNFAKTGNPTPVIDDIVTVKWKPVTDTAKNYLQIGAELSLGINPNQDVWETWERAYAIAENH